MTRYVLAKKTPGREIQYVMATYGAKGDGLAFTASFTGMRTDAGMFVTVERAAAAHRALTGNNYSDLVIVPVEDF